MQVGDIVKDLLVKFPATRDSDPYLIATYWRQELHEKDIKTIHMTGFDLLSKIAHEELTSPETIRRCRQELQRLNPELRGQKYSERHKRATEVCEAVKQGNLLEVFEERYGQ